MNVRHRLRTAPALVVTFALSILVAVGVAAIVAPFSVSADEAQPVTLVAFGDSLTAGYGVKASESFPAQLQMALQAKGYKVTVVNAGVSGDTTADGLRRFDWAMQPKPDGVILELGANDALRGVPPQETERNLDAILTRLKQRGIPVILMGMMAPPNMGSEFGEKFNAIYPKLAEKHGVALYAFFLDGVAAQAGLQLEDGMHPNPGGVDVMVEKSLTAVQAFLATISGGTK